ncbi:MAG: hypothetical protein LBF70_01510 [Holosporales bacterium]|nr:hypothetical protein [Holosporales bacterium]
MPQNNKFCEHKHGGGKINKSINNFQENIMTISILQSALSLAQLSPIVAKWLSGSNAESISEKIIGIAKSITKMQNETEVVKKLKTDKHALLLFQKALINSEHEIELAVIKDKENARIRDTAFINAGKRNKRADVMVISAAIGLFICLATIVIYQKTLPGEAVGIISTIAGIFGSCLKDAYNFEFGSSRGSKEKDQTVAAILHRNSL